MNNVTKAELSLQDIISYIRVQLARQKFTLREEVGIATCPVELMLNINPILEAAERSISTSHLEALVAQWIERQPSKLDVEGSSPSERAKAFHINQKAADIVGGGALKWLDEAGLQIVEKKASATPLPTGKQETEV
jgi:hypothetical protein